MVTSVQKNLVSSSEAYAKSFKDGSLALPPAKKYLVRAPPSSHLLLHCLLSGLVALGLLLLSFRIVHYANPLACEVTCMDARIDPAAAFGIALGDAHVIRNAGASAHDALRSIIISEQLLGTNEVLVIKHTGCGMLTFKNADAVGVVEKNLGPEAAQELRAKNFDFLPFPELEQAVKDDVAYLKGSKLVPHSVTVSGWVYEVETGRARQVV